MITRTQQLQKMFFMYVLFFFFACSHGDSRKQVDEGTVTGKIYESREIGWKMEIPKGWTII